MSTEILIRQGDSFEMFLAPGVDLTGYTVFAQARSLPTSQEAILSHQSWDGSLETGSWMIDGIENTIRLKLTATQTAALPAGRFFLEIKVRSPEGEVHSLTGNLPLRITESIVKL